MEFRKSYILIFAMLLAVTAPAMAQTVSGTLEGRVLDPSAGAATASSIAKMRM